jgi:putative sigma-54 modulation protein
MSSMSRKSKALEFVQEGFNVAVTGRHVEVTDAMKDYAIEKISKIERFTKHIIDVNVVMDIQKLQHRVDITLKLDHILIKAQGITNDMYASIDQAVHKLETQIVKYRERIRNHQAKDIASIEMNVNVIQAEDEDIDGQYEDEAEKKLIEKYRPHKIVSREKSSAKLLTIDEAIMKLELSGDVFLIFKNESDMKLKVLYKRKDHNFGLIEVES